MSHSSFAFFCNKMCYVVLIEWLSNLFLVASENIFVVIFQVLTPSSFKVLTPLTQVRFLSSAFQHLPILTNIGFLSNKFLKIYVSLLRLGISLNLHFFLSTDVYAGQPLAAFVVHHTHQSEVTEPLINVFVLVWLSAVSGYWHILLIVMGGIA